MPPLSEQWGVAMAGKTDLLRERYEQFSQGDLEAALSNWSQDFTWEGGNSEDMPGGGRTRARTRPSRSFSRPSGRGTSSRSPPTSSLRTATRSSCSATRTSRRVTRAPRCPSCISGGSAATMRSAGCRSSPTRCKARVYWAKPDPAGLVASRRFGGEKKRAARPNGNGFIPASSRGEDYAFAPPSLTTEREVELGGMLARGLQTKQ